MSTDKRDLLDVLKFEAEFLEKGGYGSSPRQPWRSPHILEDSPACMNYDAAGDPRPCSECVLTQLVPSESRGEKIPCTHVPLNSQGETLSSLYRYADQYEIEQTYGQWLHSTIAGFEAQRETTRKPGNQVPPPGRRQHQSEPLFEKFHPKCANPGCAIEFRWLEGGKFFRFRARAGQQLASGSGYAEESSSEDRVKHYWLCERCSHVFRLVYDEGHGVVLKRRWPELWG